MRRGTWFILTMVLVLLFFKYFLKFYSYCNITIVLKSSLKYSVFDAFSLISLCLNDL